MRLTCPNCGAEYEVAAGMVPPAGRHVQCTSCHTRWFVRGGPRAALSEDQILHRLENRSPRPRPVVVPEPMTAHVASAPSEAAAAEPDEPIAFLAPDGDPAGAEPPAAAATEPPPPRTTGLDKPAEHLVVPQPAPISDAAPARPAPRLELGRRPPPQHANDISRPRSRFGRGLFLPLLVFVVGLVVYVYREPLAVQVPTAAPALRAYAEQVDHFREVIEVQFGKYRAADSPA